MGVKYIDHLVQGGGGVSLEVRELLKAMKNALAGQIAFKVTPAAPEVAATAAGWTQAFKVQLVDDAGLVHKWYNATVETQFSIADTSTAGTASISSTTATFVDGEATVVVTGDAAAWVAAETATLTVTSKTVSGVTVAAATGVVTIV